MASDFFEAAFYNGIVARKQLQFAESFRHFTKALDIYCCAGYSDPCFLSEMFWQRADVSMMLGSYSMASEDIAQAIKLNERPHSDSVSIMYISCFTKHTSRFCCSKL